MPWTETALVVASTASAGGIGGLAAPWVVARLPEPDPEPEPGPEPEPDLQASSPDEDDVGPIAGASVRPPKVPYAVLARRPHLRLVYAVVCATLAGLLGWRLVSEPVGLVAVWVVVAVLGVVLADIDARTRLLPKRLVLPAYPVVVVLVVGTALVQSDGSLLVRVAIGWAAMSGVYALLWLVSPRGMGYGDVRLSGVLAIALAALGWAELVVGAYAGFVIGALVGVVLLLRRAPDRTFPFGPSMILGALAAALLGDAAGVWW